jgi:predicted restriction endonuclease
VQLGKKMSVGIEAAHVKWFNGGPDVVENGLCLCSLHHKAFDLGAIALSDDHKVLVSREFRGGREWVARFLRVSGAPLVGPQASLRFARSLRRGTARRCTAGRIVCSGEVVGE